MPIDDHPRVDLPVAGWQTTPRAGLCRRFEGFGHDVTERYVDTKEATLSLETDRTIRADGNRFQQLLENLLGDAIEYGGRDVRVTVGALADGFFVAEDGSGIPDSDREQVFEGGYSTEPDGTGYGLQTVEKVATDHGWEVRCSESAGGGVRFESTGVDFDAGYPRCIQRAIPLGTCMGFSGRVAYRLYLHPRSPPEAT